MELSKAKESSAKDKETTVRVAKEPKEEKVVYAPIRNEIDEDTEMVNVPERPVPDEPEAMVTEETVEEQTDASQATNVIETEESTEDVAKE